MGHTVVDKPKEKRTLRKDVRAIQEKKLIALLDQEIRLYQQCLLPGNKQLLDVYKQPTYRSLAERMTLEGTKVNHMTVSRLIREGESLELKILYNILQNPEHVKHYKGLAHARAVLNH